MLGLHFAADALAFGHYTKRVFAEDLLDVGVGIAAVEKGLRDFGQVGDIFHADGHVGAAIVRAESDVIGAGELHGVVNVVNDFGPINARDGTVEHHFVDEFVFGHDLAGFIFAAAAFSFTSSWSCLPISGWALLKLA